MLTNYQKKSKNINNLNWIDEAQTIKKIVMLSLKLRSLQLHFDCWQKTHILVQLNSSSKMTAIGSMLPRQSFDPIFDLGKLRLYGCSLIIISQMNDDSKNIPGLIIPKKNIKQDQEDSHKKKHKKNKRKDHADQHEEEPIAANRTELPRNRLNHQPQQEQDTEEQTYKELCCIFSAYRPTTVRKVLASHQYNKAQAMNALCQLPPDKEQEEGMGKELERLGRLDIKKPSEEDNSSTNNSEVANNLLNEVYDNLMKEEINGREFQELFQEIADMIKEDQKERGFGIFEIDSFVDECNLVKQTLLVGFREELSNFDECDFDQSYPLYAQTQQFMWETAQRRSKQQKQQEEDFPSLETPQQQHQRNIIDRIRQQEKRRQQEETQFFVPSRNVPHYARQRSNQASIFNVDNRLKSQRDLMSLHKEFSNMPIRDLKFVYMTFDGDFNGSREFLIRYYASTRVRLQEQPTRSSSVPVPAARVHTSRLKKEEVDEEVKHLSLNEIRQEIDHLFKLRQALQITKMKIKSSTQKQELDRMINEKAPLIRKLAQASRLKEVEQMVRQNPLYIDLHGYRQEEIEPLLDTVTDMLRDEYQKRNEKIRAKKVKGRLAACLTVMTGKGIHSRHNQSVLKPAVKDWCTGRGFDCEQEQDHIVVFVVLA